ncbi:MAG: DUF1707 and DUF4870 domain-containing protein [Acidipropionibacterium sp.]|nr:DUF1707 and DUF4870 domain-containing protein [Acidipropionibacterium sp.]
MTSPFAGNPFQRTPKYDQSLDWRVTDAQRDRVLDYLGQAYADGRLTISEFEKRMEDALAARTRRELNQTLSGLATVPITASITGTSMVRRRTGEPTPGGTVATGLIGLSPFIAGPFGPIIGAAVAEKGSWTRKQVANQANAQVYMVAVIVLLGILLGGAKIMALAALAYAVMTVIQAVKGFQGESWRSPITRVVPFQLFKENPPSRKTIGR